MTEEELEKQADDYATDICCDEQTGMDILFISPTEKQAFIDGAKWGMEHAIEWHDLREDPNDLPKETGQYFTDDGTIYIYDVNSKKWREPMCRACWDFDWLDDGDVIAWCELPKFKE